MPAKITYHLNEPVVHLLHLAAALALSVRSPPLPCPPSFCHSSSDSSALFETHSFALYMLTPVYSTDTRATIHLLCTRSAPKARRLKHRILHDRLPWSWPASLALTLSPRLPLVQGVSHLTQPTDFFHLLHSLKRCPRLCLPPPHYQHCSGSIYSYFFLRTGAVTAVYSIVGRSARRWPWSGLEGRPDLWLRLGPGEPEGSLSPIPNCRVFIPSARCSFASAPLEERGTYPFSH